MINFQVLSSLLYLTSNAHCNPLSDPSLAALRPRRSAAPEYGLFDHDFKPVLDKEGEHITGDPYHYSLLHQAHHLVPALPHLPGLLGHPGLPGLPVPHGYGYPQPIPVQW